MWIYVLSSIFKWVSVPVVCS